MHPPETHEHSPTGTFSYHKTTENILVEVTPFFVPEKSSLKNAYYFFAYRVIIKNLNQFAIQVLNRHWIIKDGQQNQRSINGKGIVGERPTIAPQEEFQYTSFCPLRTPTGNMRGKYEVIDELGHKYWIQVPLFFFRVPETTQA